MTLHCQNKKCIQFHVSNFKLSFGQSYNRLRKKYSSWKYKGHFHVPRPLIDREKCWKFVFFKCEKWSTWDISLVSKIMRLTFLSHLHFEMQRLDRRPTDHHRKAIKMTLFLPLSATQMFYFFTLTKPNT